MSSLEIAERTGKNHADVLRDIRVMLEALDEVASKFAGNYRASNGKENPCFNLPKRESLILGLPRLGGHRERFCVRCFCHAENPSPVPGGVP
ncbi:Rha family transcriptional regulator, partial [Methylobacterium sp. EM32]|uniref:Rha family transcriptional regulator n=1 Tax=Methylobacterium sp. EM32 TaxID=3163481 RepID=UPI0033A425EE